MKIKDFCEDSMVFKTLMEKLPSPPERSTASGGLGGATGLVPGGGGGDGAAAWTAAQTSSVSRTAAAVGRFSACVRGNTGRMPAASSGTG